MYSLSIFFGPSPVPAQFLFKDKEKAEAIRDVYIKYKSAAAREGFINGADDYGQSFVLPFESIHGIIFEDMDLGEESRIQRGLSQARGQAKANERARTDPMLRSAMGGQGPSVLTPFGRNGFNG